MPAVAPGDVVAALGAVDVVLGDMPGLVELLDVDGLMVEEPDVVELVVTRVACRASPVPLNSTVTRVPAASPDGTSDEPETVKRCRPLGVSITSSEPLDETTVPETVVAEALVAVVAGDCPGLARPSSLWA
jgi:hypothetical protein